MRLSCRVDTPSQTPPLLPPEKAAHTCDTSMNDKGAERIVEWLKQSKPGGILGDHMGCGKTHTFLSAASLPAPLEIFDTRNKSIEEIYAAALAHQSRQKSKKRRR
mmetsp:Transcript_76963/g.230934  ORF Transcript_76963/g.230934 Transcript_76963/m.230934 type:complete len:105 (+) Transcript_76963:58-372(+)